MLRPRIIPCLLVHKKGLVKTIQFNNPKYVGDPINAVRIFNEKQVDELMVLDIDATRDGRAPDFKMIENLAAECRMPLCYGGGVTSVNDAETIFSLGVEKVAICSAAVNNPELIKNISTVVGAQSTIVVADVKLNRSQQYTIRTKNGTLDTGITIQEYVKKAEQSGAGEIVINNIDRDGTMIGYDEQLISLIRPLLKIPITVLGGAGKLEDIQNLIHKFGVMGIAAGSLFVFKGVHKAVLINYPNMAKKDELIFKASILSI